MDPSTPASKAGTESDSSSGSSYLGHLSLDSTSLQRRHRLLRRGGTVKVHKTVACRIIRTIKFSFNKSHKTCVKRVLPSPISPLHLLVVLSRMALVDTIFPYLKNSSVYTRPLCADKICLFMLTISTETQRANLNSWARAGAWRRMKTSDNEAEREGYRTQIK